MDRHAQILASAARLFRERGFHGVSVDEIGREVGVTGGALYHHFSGKDEILATLFDDAMDKVVLETEDLYEDPRSELDALIRHHARFVVANASLVAVYAHEHRSLVEPWKRLFTRRVRMHAARWERSVARCYPEADRAQVAITVQAAIGLLHSVVFWPRTLLARKDIVDLLVAGAMAVIEALAHPQTTG